MLKILTSETCNAVLPVILVLVFFFFYFITWSPGREKQLLVLESYEVNQTEASAKAYWKNFGPLYRNLQVFHVTEVRK